MATKAILTVGLALPPSETATALQNAAKSAISTANRSGYDARLHAIDPANTNHMDGFHAVLKERSWDGVMIGWGIRGNAEHTVLFEKMVNMVVQEAGSDTKFIFSLKPDSFMEALQRVFGEI